MLLSFERAKYYWLVPAGVHYCLSVKTKGQLTSHHLWWVWIKPTIAPVRNRMRQTDVTEKCLRYAGSSGCLAKRGRSL